MNEEYAIQIARDWNVPASGSGFVTKFSLSAACLNRYEIQNVGGAIHNELWVPAEDLEDFNDHNLFPAKKPVLHPAPHAYHNGKR
jgi:hypothetical protein